MLGVWLVMRMGNLVGRTRVCGMNGKFRASQLAVRARGLIFQFDPENAVREYYQRKFHLNQIAKSFARYVY